MAQPIAGKPISGWIRNRSWRFDFFTRDGHMISGKIEDDLAPERAAELNREFFNLPAIATLDKTNVLFKNGRERTTHTLKSLKAE